jgi:hypothetical protein
LDSIRKAEGLSYRQNWDKLLLANARGNHKRGAYPGQSDLSEDWLYRVLDEQDRRCAILELPLDIQSEAHHRFNNYCARPSICRVDLSQGYLKGNCLVVSTMFSRSRVRGASLSATENFWMAMLEPENFPVLDRVPYMQLAKCLSRARTRDTGCTLTIGQLKDLWMLQGGRCVWSRLPLYDVASMPSSCWLLSIDRRDVTKGYSLENVQLVCNSLNNARVAQPGGLFHSYLLRWIEQDLRSF